MRTLNTSMKRRTRYRDLSTEVRTLKNEGDAVVLRSQQPEHHRLDKNRFIFKTKAKLNTINLSHTPR